MSTNQTAQTTTRFANTAPASSLTQLAGRASNNGIQNPADGFLNLYLPGAEGETRRKLGAIAVRKTTAREAQLIEAFEKNPEAVAKWVVANLEVEYQSAAVNTGFDLPDFGETEQDPADKAAV